MSEVYNIRELHLYSKMYNHLFNSVSDVINNCKDEKSKHLLIKAQQETEEIYMSENIPSHKLTADEKTIILLLEFIRDSEALKPANEIDCDCIKDCVDWLLDLQNKNINLSEEEVKRRVDQIFNS